MFFRNAKPKVWTFDDRLASLKQAGFAVSREPRGATVTRGGFGATIEDKGNGDVAIGKAGFLVGKETAVLVNGGYPMFLPTPSGKELPPLAAHPPGPHRLAQD